MAGNLKKQCFPTLRKMAAAIEIQLGAYQTTFVTEGPKEFSLMYLGKGTAADYEGKDVTGKLVLVDINQRDEWWINYPVYQAHLKGAAALIAVQSGGYGEIDDEALNAQDIAGPEDAPAFSISRKDSQPVKGAAGAHPGNHRNPGRGQPCHPGLHHLQHCRNHSWKASGPHGPVICPL